MSRSSCRSSAQYGRRDAPAVRRALSPNLERRYRETNSEWSRGEIEEVMSEQSVSGVPRPPPAATEVLAVTVGGLNIAEFAEMSVVEALEFLNTLELTEMQHR